MTKHFPANLRGFTQNIYIKKHDSLLGSLLMMARASKDVFLVKNLKYFQYVYHITDGTDGTILII